MTASADLSIISLILHASIVVKIVLTILLALSVISWTMIFQKWFRVQRAQKATEDFEKRFWGGADLGSLFEGAQMRRDKSGPEEKIFAAGMAEYTKLQDRGIDSAHVLDGVKRAMRAVYQREMDSLESGLSILASIGSVSPASPRSPMCRSPWWPLALRKRLSRPLLAFSRLFRLWPRITSTPHPPAVSSTGLTPSPRSF